MTSDETGDAIADVPATTMASGRFASLGHVALLAGAVAGTVLGIWFGLATLALEMPDVVASFPTAPYALDGYRHLVVASLVAAGGDPYTVLGFFYSPLGALVAVPFAAIGTDAALWVWFVIKIAIVVLCVIDATRRTGWIVRITALSFVLTSVFIRDDLWLGNVSIVMAAALYLAVSRERPLASVPLGIVVAAVAKPFLLPVLAWMFVFRTRSAVVTVTTGLVATGATALVLGPTIYRDYVGALTRATDLDLHFGLGLSGVAPPLLIPASLLVLVFFAILLLASRDESATLMWSLLIGLIAAPYVGHYAVIPVLAGFPMFARDHPSRALLYAAVVAPLALLALVPATIVGLLIAFPTDVLERFRARGRDAGDIVAEVAAATIPGTRC